MILSHMQIEEIAAAVTKDFNEFFFGKDADNERSTAQATPIDQFAKDYLGLSVSFAHLSSDGSLCGLTAYADTEYTIEEEGVKRTIPLKANQVLLDMSFIQPGQVHALCGKRRFTLAHECAHQILFGMESDNDKRTHESKYAPRVAYSLRDLKTREDWNEWQANAEEAILPPCGFSIHTKNYQYMLRCIPRKGDYNFYLYCYNKEAREQERTTPKNIRPIAKKRTEPER